MAEKGTLDGVSDRSIERWTQPASFMDAFTWRALNLTCFTQPVKNFVKARNVHLPRNGAYKQKSNPYSHWNSAINGHNLRTYPRLVTRKHARDTAVLAARLKLQSLATLRKLRQIKSTIIRQFRPGHQFPLVRTLIAYPRPVRTARHH